MKQLLIILLIGVISSCGGVAGGDDLPPKKSIEDKIFGTYLSNLKATVQDPPDTLILTNLGNNQIKVYESDKVMTSVNVWKRLTYNYTMSYNEAETTFEVLAFNVDKIGIKVRSKSSTLNSCDCVNIYKNGVNAFEGAFTPYYKK